MEKELSYLQEKFCVRPSVGYDAEKSICTSAEFSRKEFIRLCGVLGEKFFDYIDQVVVHRDMGSAAVILSQRVRENLKQSFKDSEYGKR